MSSPSEPGGVAGERSGGALTRTACLAVGRQAAHLPAAVPDRDDDGLRNGADAQ